MLVTTTASKIVGEMRLTRDVCVCSGLLEQHRRHLGQGSTSRTGLRYNQFDKNLANQLQSV
eukprot:3795755-Amphidinium_carterae.1